MARASRRRKRTRVSTTSARCTTPPGRARAKPVATRCSRPASCPTMRAASPASAGLPSMTPPCSTIVSAACAARPSAPAPAELAAAAPAGEAANLIEDAAREHPVLADYALYFQARAARAAGHAGSALESARRLVGSHPDSIWVGPAWLMAGQLEQAGGDLAGARA